MDEEISDFETAAGGQDATVGFIDVTGDDGFENIQIESVDLAELDLSDLRGYGRRRNHR